MKKKTAQAKFLLLLLLVALFGAVAVSLWPGEEKKENSTASLSCTGVDLSDTGEFKSEGRVALFEGREVYVPALALKGKEKRTAVLGAVSQERWIEVDLSEQKLIAWDGETKFLETKMSSGLPWSPTPKGEFRIWTKFKYTKMEGGQGKYYYYLPNVPYVMFFENSEVPGYKGYGLHGTYWHNDFGTPRSHGCVNLPTPIAEKLFYWTGPDLPSEKWAMRASDQNPGTRIVIHE
ncbi:MAG: L,D-transpeptidase [Candidatus Blackburnbacteria bacterium]|nr:L,D-transpeptidase [Candidatus Blackburnbacteria bacterium]